MDNKTKRIIEEMIKNGKEIGQCVVCGTDVMDYEPRYCPNGILHCLECGMKIKPIDLDAEYEKIAKELVQLQL